jgi:hypothetical protein
MRKQPLAAGRPRDNRDRRPQSAVTFLQSDRGADARANRQAVAANARVAERK